MDLSSFQRKAIIFIFISILIGAILAGRKEPLLLEKWSPKTELPAEQTSKTPEKININTADIALITKLPGIGPGLSKQIFDYRNSHGPFMSIEDLKNVPGIGPKRLLKIEDKIILGDVVTDKEKQYSSKINLNKAGKAQLTTIPGIGPKTAQAIVSYRDKNGPFNNIEELISVPRIGDKTLENIKDYFYIEEKPSDAEILKETAYGNKITPTDKLSHEIDTKAECPHCGKIMWEKGRRKKVYIRCPKCLKLLNS